MQQTLKPTELIDAERNGSTVTAYPTRGKRIKLNDHELTYVGDSTGSPLKRGVTYRIVADPSSTAPQCLTLENTDTQKRIEVWWSTLCHYLCDIYSFHIG